MPTLESPEGSALVPLGAICHANIDLAKIAAQWVKRSIYVGRMASYEAEQHDEMQAVAGALSLLANIVMAWNTMKMQASLDRWHARAPACTDRPPPTRTEGIKLRAVFAFPIQQYAEQLLPPRDEISRPCPPFAACARP